MNKLFIAAVIAVTFTGFTSCSKCQICTKDSASEVHICENDFDNHNDYGLALKWKKTNGYNCK